MIGILMLDTRFPRIKGDIGNPDSFPSPVIYRRVEQATVANVVRSALPPAGVSAAIIGAARELRAGGATIIGTSCGFLVTEQSRLQSAVTCPVLSSSLLLIPLLRTMYGDEAGIGILTFDADRLKPLHLNAGFDRHLVVQGLPRQGELYRTIARDEASLDVARAGEDVVAAARALLSRAPGIAVLLLECTNISPFKEDLRQRFGLPVFDLVDALVWAYAAAPAQDV